MKSDELISKMKEADNTATVQNLAKEFGFTRQTMYRYVDQFAEGRYEKIPENVYNRIVSLVGEPKNASAARKSGGMDDLSDIRKTISEYEYAIYLLELDIKDLESPSESVMEVASEEEIRDRVGKLEDAIKGYQDEIAKLREEATARAFRSAKALTGEPIDARIERLVKDGRYGGPSWQGNSRSTSNALCISEGGEYMVITDDLDVGPGKSELFLYAIIAGKRVHIATYQFKENESFVRFSLIPKLSYYYEVVSYAFGEEYRTGILELSSCV